MDLYKYFLDVSDRTKILPVILELADKVESEHGIVVRNMSKKDFEQEVRRFMEVYNSAWEKNWGFVPLTDAELEDYAKQLKPLLDERWAWIAEKDGETVGAALTLLDWNEVLIGMNGRLFPIGWLKFLIGRKKIEHVRVFAQRFGQHSRNQIARKIVRSWPQTACGDHQIRARQCLPHRLLDVSSGVCHAHLTAYDVA